MRLYLRLRTAAWSLTAYSAGWATNEAWDMGRPALGLVLLCVGLGATLMAAANIERKD